MSHIPSHLLRPYRRKLPPGEGTVESDAEVAGEVEALVTEEVATEVEVVEDKAVKEDAVEDAKEVAKEDASVWDPAMKKEELIAVAKLLDIVLPEKSTKPEIIAILEKTAPR